MYIYKMQGEKKEITYQKETAYATYTTKYLLQL